MSSAGAFAVLVIALSGCAHGVIPAAPEPVFLDAAPLLGEAVSVRGTLAWEFPERDLYPPGTTARERRPGLCLPILIPIGDPALAATATRLNGQAVRVDGVIVPAVASGPDALANCKPVGIRVDALTAER